MRALILRILFETRLGEWIVARVERATGKRAARLGISETALETIAHLTDNEIKTQRCNDCEIVMKIHPGGAWRFAMHPIRCEECLEWYAERGHSVVEAKYVR